MKRRIPGSGYGDLGSFGDDPPNKDAHGFVSPYRDRLQKASDPQSSDRSAQAANTKLGALYVGMLAYKEGQKRKKG